MKMIDALSTPLLQTLAIALGISLLGNAGLGLYAWGLRAQQTLATERLGDAPATNALTTEALNSTITALEACVGLDTFIDRQWQHAQAANAEAARTLAAARALNATQRSNAYATDPTCRAWADQPVCAAVSNGLQ